MGGRAAWNKARLGTKVAGIVRKIEVPVHKPAIGNAFTAASERLRMANEAHARWEGSQEVKNRWKQWGVKATVHDKASKQAQARWARAKLVKKAAMLVPKRVEEQQEEQEEVPALGESIQLRILQIPHGWKDGFSHLTRRRLRFAAWFFVVALITACEPCDSNLYLYKRVCAVKISLTNDWHMVTSYIAPHVLP